MFHDEQIVHIEYIRENYKNAAIRGITLLNEPFYDHNCHPHTTFNIRSLYLY